MVEEGNRSNRLLFTKNFLLGWIVVFAVAYLPCMAWAETKTKTETPERSASHQSRQENVINSNSNSNSNSNGDLLLLTDYNNDGIEYNPCSVCQGLDILADTAPFPDSLPNTTCEELNFLFENTVTNETAASILVGIENATHEAALIHEHAHFEIKPETCRADPLFNQVFDRCCRASIPLYQCEENVHDYLFNEGGYNTAAPPIVNPDEKLHIDVFLEYEALEEIKVEEGEHTSIERCGMK